MSLSIRRRLAVWIAIALILTLTALFFTLRFTLRGILNSDIDTQLSDDQQRVSAPVVAAGSLSAANLPAIVENSSFIAVVRDLDGRELAATPRLDVASLALNEDEITRVLQGETIERTVDIDGEPFRVWSSRLTVGRKVVGVVQVGESAEAVASVTDALEIVFLVAGAVAALLALAIGYWLARSALKPIDNVTAVAREIEASDLSRRIQAHRQPEEVQRLADTFDAMLERLNAAFQQQRNFVLDVSHELRTPLTALRGNLDVLLMHEDLGTEARAQLERMSMEVGRLVRLTSNLLYLAHVDAGRGVDRRPVAMDDLCLEVYRQAKDLRPEVRLRLGGEDQVTVMGDRDLLKQLILNLVDNGLKYTPPGGEVTLSLYAEDSWARIVVQDTGPGIPPDDLPHIFDRYYRGAGSGGRGGSGAGIGLAITEWVARAHGGRIEVGSEVGKGSTFTVHLPLDSGPAGSSGGGAGV
jgi:heavy metal sensor kinase